MLTVLRQFEASLVMWASRHPGLAVVVNWMADRYVTPPSQSPSWKPLRPTLATSLAASIAGRRRILAHADGNHDFQRHGQDLHRAERRTCSRRVHRQHELLPLSWKRLGRKRGGFVRDSASISTAIRSGHRPSI